MSRYIILTFLTTLALAAMSLSASKGTARGTNASARSGYIVASS